MIDATVPIRAPIRAAVEPLGAKLYINTRAEPDGTTVMPHLFLYSTTESPGVFLGHAEDVVSLDIFARSQGDLATLENAIEFLDDYYAGNYGTATAIRYVMQSKTRTPEGSGVWHSTILFAVRYVDNRKFD